MLEPKKGNARMRHRRSGDNGGLKLGYYEIRNVSLTLAWVVDRQPLCTSGGKSKASRTTATSLLRPTTLVASASLLSSRFGSGAMPGYSAPPAHLPSPAARRLHLREQLQDQAQSKNLGPAFTAGHVGMIIAGGVAGVNRNEVLTPGHPCFPRTMVLGQRRGTHIRLGILLSPTALRQAHRRDLLRARRTEAVVGGPGKPGPRVISPSGLCRTSDGGVDQRLCNARDSRGDGPGLCLCQRQPEVHHVRLLPRARWRAGPTP